ncbi:putative trna pseudouridine synthase [Brettanomyces bruxellensis AWRI1499]|nr:putative trna pseudouridine synthase [Brettanomyces bruxellensis AWRI1499]
MAIKMTMNNASKKRAFSDYSGWNKDQLIERIKLLEDSQGLYINNEANFDRAQKRVHESAKERREAKKIRKINKQRGIDFSKYETRHIALKFSYLGWDYQGLALQGLPTDRPTVEEVIIKALQQVRLVQSANPADFLFSRCGRTDRGVSAMNQVISLRVRSRLTKEQLKDPANDNLELDYIKMLNHVLPADIRFHAICVRPPKGFDARFSCQWRQYKYIFNSKGLDIDRMRKAAQMFVGQHDFRNFCKVDGSKQLKNFTREVYSTAIESLEQEPGFSVFDLKGSAFLWHQVRYMVAVLLTIGQKLEEPTIVKDLLNINMYPCRPAYKLAHDIPLILYDCGYDPQTVKWTAGPSRKYVSQLALDGLTNNYKVKSIVVEYMQKIVECNIPQKMDKTIVNLGDGAGQVCCKFIHYDKRQKVEPPEVTNAKWLNRKMKHVQCEMEEDS